MGDFIAANVEEWMIPHFKTIGKPLCNTRLNNNCFDSFSPEKPLLLGFAYLDDFAELGSIGDILHIAVKLGLIKKIIYLSCSSVYKPGKEPYKEDSTLSPMNYVGTRAVILENILTYLCRRYGIDLTILRPFNPYGPFQRAPYVVPTVLEEIIKNGTVRIGDTEKVRDFLYIGDLVELVRTVFERKDKGLHVYNVSSGIPVSIHGLIMTAQEVTGGSCNVIFDASKLRVEYDYDYAVADITKIKKEIGWMPNTNLRTGLSLTYQWILGRSGKYV